MQVIHVYLVSHATSLLLPDILPRYLTSYQSHQSVFSDHFPFAIKDCDHSLTHRLRPAALTPKEVRNSQLFPPRGLAENPIPCVLRLWLDCDHRNWEHPPTPCFPQPHFLRFNAIKHGCSVFVNVLSGVKFLMFIIELLKIWREDKQTSKEIDRRHAWTDSQCEQTCSGRPGALEGLGLNQSPRIWSVALQIKPALDTERGGFICIGNLPVWPSR